MSGKKIQMHVNETTYLEGTFKAGDMAYAYVTDKGHAQSVYHITHVQSSP